MVDEIGRLRRLCAELIERAETHPETARELASRVERLLVRRQRSSAPGRGNRRAEPTLDPFEVLVREGPEALSTRLEDLDLEQLRDIVAHYGMDPRRLVMKWKRRDRVVEHIVETVGARSRKGEAFRSPMDAGGGKELPAGHGSEGVERP